MSRFVLAALLLAAWMLFGGNSGCDVRTLVAPNACDLFIQVVDKYNKDVNGGGIPDAYVTVLDPLQTSTTDAGGWTLCFGTNANAQWAEARVRYLDALHQWRESGVFRIRLAHGTTYAKVEVTRRVVVGAPSLDGTRAVHEELMVVGVETFDAPPLGLPIQLTQR